MTYFASFSTVLGFSLLELVFTLQIFPCVHSSLILYMYTDAMIFEMKFYIEIMKEALQ